MRYLSRLTRMETENLAERAISRIKEAEGLKYDADVAACLEVETKRVSQWKYRGTPPYEKLVEYSRKQGISLDWLLNERGPMRIRDIVAEPGEIYRIATDQDAVYAIAGDVYRALQETGTTISPEKYQQTVRLLHRDMLQQDERTIPFDKVLEIVRLAADKTD